MHKYTNKLINETSPYLLQHAYNPVNWFPWGDEALQKARDENKPILVSIGYAACHWCHVMERESFEDEQTAALMNEHFINIKIDREERPDLDHIYMDAVQTMTGSGGWPLNVFLTPDTKPFYGGTYFPPVRAFNRASWKETLQAIVQAFKEKRNEIDEQAASLTTHLINSNSFGLQKSQPEEQVFSKEKVKEAFENLMKNADKEWGGFGRAPKFPQTFSIQFLLRYYHFLKDESALNQALLSLDKMIEGGIYDQVGGGFARYSTDTEWLVPHFEKMLYDNALLVITLSEAYQLTKNDRYKEVIGETMQYIKREMLHPENGFFSALDADSEGEEGKFYIWDKEEVVKLLGSNAETFCKYYDITYKGNWNEEHSYQNGKNILRVLKKPEQFASENNISVNSLMQIIQEGKMQLLEKRSRRIRPLLDDKILLGWNALMNTACSKAFAATGNEDYRRLAIQNMEFLLDTFSLPDSNEFCHTWKNGEAKFPAFLDDYAFLIQALINLQEITADTRWLLKAKDITEFVIDHFSEAETGFFFYTKAGQKDIIVRKKEVYDGAIPSGNAVMAGVLNQLAILLDKEEWKKLSYNMISSLHQVISKYPTSFGCWNCLLIESSAGFVEIALTGKNFNAEHKEMLKQFVPNKVLMATMNEGASLPLLAGKPVKPTVFIYVCKEFSCLEPTASVDKATQLINGANRLN